MTAFCAIQDIADFLQIPIGAENASAPRAITEASAMIQNYCHQQIERAEDEYTFDVPAGRDRLFLPELPVIEIASLTENDVTLTAGSDYKLGRDGVLHRVGRYWQPGVQNVTVTYTHGYETIPDDVKYICARAAARAYQAGLRAAALAGVPGITSQGIGDYSVQYGGEQAGGGAGVDGGTLGASAAPILLPSEKKLLDKYRYRGA